MTEKVHRDRMVNFRLTAREHAQLVAAAKGTELSEFIRKAVFKAAPFSKAASVEQRIRQLSRRLSKLESTIASRVDHSNRSKGSQSKDARVLFPKRARPLPNTLPTDGSSSPHA